MFPPAQRTLPFAVMLTFALVAPCRAENEALTIYSTAVPGVISPDVYRQSGQGPALPGYAVVRHERDISLDKGKSTVRFSDVAEKIDPTTVAFESITDPQNTRVLEQNFQFDLVNTAKLMEKYIDSEVTVEQVHGDKVEAFTGTLLSMAGGLVLRIADGSVKVFNHHAGVRFPRLPGGLITRPTLVWDILAQKPGAHRARVSYQTGGMTWWADYNLIYSEGKNANACKLDVGAWVSIINQSGASYPEARLKLIAGDVHRAPQSRAVAPQPARAALAQEATVGGFEEKAFFEYHLYTLGRPSTLPDNSTKQIELFPTARGADCERKLVYYGLAPAYRGFSPNPITDRNYGIESNKKVDVYLSFKNAKEQNLGVPLPSGRVRVSKLDPADRTLEFIGEDVIDHTPKDEKVLIKMGSAFDVVGERRQVDYSVDTKARTLTEEIEVKLRNHKNEPVTVEIKENLYRWVNWKVVKKSHDYEKIDSRTIHFPVRVAPEGETTMRYTAHYSW
jgi:hypothetical protein